MCCNVDVNDAIDWVVNARRSVRSFKEEVPPKELIEQVIKAGRLAPYAGLANKGTTDFRRFFIIPCKSEKINKIREMVLEGIKSKLVILEHENNPNMGDMLNVMRIMSEKGLLPWNAPYLIITAERRGFPQRENEALAHCLQNMWLKATALGLSVQLVSAICDLNDDKRFSKLLELPEGEFSFNACMIGYSNEPAREIQRNEPHLDIKWME